MGYTHYWRQENGEIPAAAWANITADARMLIHAAAMRQIHLWREYDEPDTAPLVDAEGIFFNGTGDEGHETFVLNRDGEDFQFCKTAYKRYDLVVVAILAAAQQHAPDHIKVSSDGDAESWAAGLAFAKEVLGRDVPLPPGV